MTNEKTSEVTYADVVAVFMATDDAAATEVAFDWLRYLELRARGAYLLRRQEARLRASEAREACGHGCACRMVLK